MTSEPEILERVRAHALAVFTRGAYNLNLVAERSANTAANRFDDRFYAVYRDEAGAWQSPSWACTTDPGLYWLENPGRAEGTAILAPGQYRGAWVVGRHRDAYPALVQDRPVAVFRDRNRDGRIDKSGTLYRGIFGINIHRANATRPSTAVERWSAGCVVFADPVAYAEYWKLIEESARRFGPRFSMTLLEQAA